MIMVGLFDAGIRASTLATISIHTQCEGIWSSCKQKIT